MGNKVASARSRRNSDASTLPNNITNTITSFIKTSSPLKPLFTKNKEKSLSSIDVVDHWKYDAKWQEKKVETHQKYSKSQDLLSSPEHIGELSVLPREIQMYILSFLTPKSLCVFGQVNWACNYLSEQSDLWKQLHMTTFNYTAVADKQQHQTHEHFNQQMQPIDWKSLYKEEFLFGGVWNPKKKGKYLSLSNENYTVQINGPGWTGIMVGKNELPPVGKHHYSFRVDSDSEGMMIALASQFDPYKDNYPGNGHHGITVKELHSSVSVAFYSQRQKDDVITMSVNFLEWTVSFRVVNAKGKEVFSEQELIPEQWRGIPNWTVLGSLCSLGEMITILKQ